MDNIVKMLDFYSILNNTVYNKEGNFDVSCSHSLREYRITKDGLEYKILETNLSNNRTRKNKSHLAFSDTDEKKIIEFIITRKIA